MADRFWGVFVLMLSCYASMSEQASGFGDNTTIWTRGLDVFSRTEDTLGWLERKEKPTVQIKMFGPPEPHLESIAFHYASSLIIFSDTRTKTVFVFKPLDNEAFYAHVGTSPEVGHVAVDWLSNNVYWADSGFGWIGLQSLRENIGPPNSRLRVVVSSSLEKPYGVTVLPHVRRIFWTDYGYPPKLESAGLLGDNRRILVWQGLARPIALAADRLTHRLYWIDEAKHTIETCDPLGLDRRLLVYVKGATFGGLHLFEDYILFSRRDTGTIHASDKTTGTAVAECFEGGPTPEAIAVYSASSQPTDNATCSSTSCDICIHGGPACVCASGYSVSDDGTTCDDGVTSIWKSFIISTPSQICAVPVTLLYSHPFLTNDYIRRSIQCFVNATNIRHLAVDSRTASVYYVSGTSIRVRHMHIGGDTLIYSAGITEIAGLAYDWTHKLILWSERGSSNSIAGTVVTGTGRQEDSGRKVVYRDLSTPGDIATDPRRGELFWFESAGGNYQLYRGTVDGAQTKTAVFSSDLTQPHRLVYDHRTTRVYWLDRTYVGSVRRDGTGKNQFSVSSFSQRLGLTVFRGYLMWTEDATNVKMTFRDVDLTQDDNSVTFTLYGISSTVSDIEFYDTNGNIDDACELDNGRCSHLCVLEGSSHSCRCHFGYQLGQDGVSCTAEPVEENFFTVTDKLSSEIYQIGSSDRRVRGTFRQEGARPERVTFDPVARNAIWFDAEARAIKTSSVNGSSVTVLASIHASGASQTHSVTSLCVDTSANTLYFAQSTDNSSEGWIRVIHLDKGVTRTLYSTSVDPPKYLAVSPQTGKIIYGSRSGNIFSADMTLDNTRRLEAGVVGLSGLVFLNNGESVAWSDVVKDEIVSLHLATNTQTVHLAKSGNSPHSLAVSASELFFLTSSGRTIKSLSREEKEEVVASFAEFGELTSLFYQGPATTQESSACSEKNGRCSTFCIPTPSGRQCQCEDSVDLAEDKRTCKNIERCPAAIQQGQLSSTCSRYPQEICDFTCQEGYKKNPAAPSSISCGDTGLWNVPTNTLCLITCPRSLANGKVSDKCELTAGESCTVTCNDGFKLNGAVTAAMTCGDDGKWIEPPQQMCVTVDPHPVYIIVVVVIVIVVVITVLVICLILYRRMKKYGGRDSSRTGFDNLPVVFVTGASNVTATGIEAAKQITDDDGNDSASAEYDELEHVAEDVRYTSFSKISPRMERGRRPCQPPPFQGLESSGDGGRVDVWGVALQGWRRDGSRNPWSQEGHDDPGEYSDPLPQSHYLQAGGRDGDEGAGRLGVGRGEYLTPGRPLRIVNGSAEYMTPVPD